MKKIFYLSFSILISSLLMYSCKDNDVEDLNTDYPLMRLANQQIAAGDFDSAIRTLNLLLKTNIDQSLVKAKMAHAYAGCAGFNSNKFYNIINKSESIEFSNNFSSNLISLSKLNNQLSNKESNCLDQSIKIYQELSFRIQDANELSNLKWSSLHNYRLINRLQKTNFIKNKTLSEEELIREIFIYGDNIAEDLYRAYLMMDHSYESVQRVSNKLESSLYSLFLSKGVKFQNNSNSRIGERVNPINILDHDLYAEVILPSLPDSHRKFISEIIKNNPMLVKNLISQILAQIEYDQAYEEILSIGSSEDFEELKKDLILILNINKLAEEEINIEYLNNYNKIKEKFQDQDLNHIIYDLNIELRKILDQAISEKDHKIITNYLLVDKNSIWAKKIKPALQKKYTKPTIEFDRENLIWELIK